MKAFSKFYFKSFTFNETTKIAIFNYSFDNDIFFSEEINFSAAFYTVRDDFD
jgi:hypothetical protein